MAGRGVGGNDHEHLCETHNPCSGEGWKLGTPEDILMAYRVLGFAHDLRSNTHIVYTQMTIIEYLKLVGPDFDSFEIQRARQKHSIYERMRKEV